MPKYIIIKKTDAPNARHGYRKSASPYIHTDKASAIAEAIRLAEVKQCVFCIYEEVAVIAPPAEAAK